MDPLSILYHLYGQKEVILHKIREILPEMSGKKIKYRIRYADF